MLIQTLLAKKLDTMFCFLNLYLQLFNGDFVDRGSFSVECIFTLLGFKMLYPNHFFMSRGKSSVYFQPLIF